MTYATNSRREDGLLFPHSMHCMDAITFHEATEAKIQKYEYILDAGLVNVGIWSLQSRFT